MAKRTPPEEAFAALLEGELRRAPREMIGLAKMAAALQPSARPGPAPQFRNRLRNELLAKAAVSDEENFAAVLEGEADIPELAPLAAVASALASDNRPLPAPGFRYALRRRLIEEAARPKGARARVAAAVGRANVKMRRSLRAVGATGLAATMLMGSGAALAASQGADPDQTLYPVKRFRESTQLVTLAGAPKGTRLLDNARTRLGEVASMSRRGIDEQPLYIDTLGDMDRSTLEGTSLLIDAFRKEGGRALLERVTKFSRLQTMQLTNLIDRLPPGVRPAARDSLVVAERVGARADLVLRGCPCPSNALLEEPQPAPAIVPGPGDAPSGCACAPVAGGSSASDDGTTGSGQTGSPEPGPGNGQEPAPPVEEEPGITDPLPDVPGTQLDDQIKDIVDDVVSTPPPPLPLPTVSTPTLPL